MFMHPTSLSWRTAREPLIGSEVAADQRAPELRRNWTLRLGDSTRHAKVTTTLLFGSNLLFASNLERPFDLIIDELDLVSFPL